MRISDFFRWLPDFKGKRRLVRVISKKYFKEAGNIRIRGKWQIQYLLPNLKESISIDLFVNGVYEPGTHNLLMKLIPRNGVLLDLGANIGSIALPIAKRRSDVKVLCVEAAPWIYEFLQDNVHDNNLENSVITINRAVSERSNESLPFYSPKDQFGKGSLSPVFTSDAIPVSTITMPDLLREQGIQKVDVIKIDIEGFEYFAFKGAISMLTSDAAPTILFEFVDWAEKHAGLQPGDAQRLLIELGYNLYLFRETGQLTKLDKVLVEGCEILIASKQVNILC
jgi:FkbM family methyltransferase